MMSGLALYSTVVPLVALAGLFATTAGAAKINHLPFNPLPTPPPVTVAGNRVYFTRDQETGGIGVHVSDLQPEHVDFLKTVRPLGTVFLSRIAAEDFKRLEDVPMTGLFLWDAPIGDKGLAEFKGHAQLESVLFHRCQVTDAAIDILATMPSLKRISISYDEITDAGLIKVAELNRLTNVDFFKCAKITDEGVVKLAQLQSLERLFLNNNPQLTRRVIRPLCSLKNLNRLELDEIQVTGQDIMDLGQLPKLETLGLSKSGVDDDSARHFVALKSLKSLTLNQTAITDAGVAHLKGMTWLKSLGLSRNALTDRAVSDLLALEDLEYLGLAATGITDAGFRELSKLTRLKTLRRK
jgi:hypothetical protein